MNQRSIIIFALLSVAVFTGLAVYGDARELFKSILLVSPVYWIGAFLLTVVHVVVRMARWHYFLRVVGVSADLKTTSLIFVAGFSMLMVPGRIGELAKSLFLRQKADVQIRTSAPVILTERILDVMSVLFLGIWGLIFIPFGWVIILVTLLGFAALTVMLASAKGVALLIRLPLLRRWDTVLADSGQTFRKLYTAKVLAIGFALGLFAWLLIGVSFWVVLQGFQAQVQAPAAVSIFSASTLLGSITMLPGGLITTEGSMLAMLSRVGLGSTTATAAILIIRVITLWMTVLIGFVALLILRKYQPSMPRPTEDAREQTLEPAAAGHFVGSRAGRTSATPTGADS
ncbi:MAG: flippase-like domain-containing protein [Chloroflexi bacterium]|nr:flippase-like domain-containing protein [Chloroflexota bacterium]